ncbi:hypothetical protein [Alteromonas antoniana]|uniref:hypothetical protein n=1 Tax=Alteromonas antoniana TaxID=2803813 RepID=UPI001C456B9B|nr:hypothetical protein [Alteromonas antoniana]
MNLGRGVVIVHDMYLQKRKPNFRDDLSFEDHSLAVFMEYAEYASSQGLGVLFTGTSIKQVSIRHALMLMQLKERVPLFVTSTDASQVHPALLDMNCIKAIEPGEHTLAGSRFVIGPDVGDIAGGEKHLLFADHQVYIRFRDGRSSDVRTHVLYPSLQSSEGRAGEATVLTGGINPKRYASSFEDAAMVCDMSLPELPKTTFSFTERLRELNEIKMKKCDVDESGVSPIQGMINELTPGYAKDQVQTLFNAVSTEQL